MVSRFTPFELPRWRESDELRRMLSSFERVLPLRKPSNLAQRDIVQRVHAASGGLTGTISQVLNRAAESAIRDGSEQILVSHIDVAAREMLH
jgi:AAA+ superfamily predicted ATPase